MMCLDVCFLYDSLSAAGTVKLLIIPMQPQWAYARKKKNQKQEFHTGSWIAPAVIIVN